MSEPEGGVEGQVWKRNLLTPKLVAIVLGIDVFLILFAAVTTLGVRWLPTAVGLGVGSALIVLCLLGAALVRRSLPLAIGIGWLVQAALVAAGFAYGAMFVVGGLSLILWVWCLWRGGKSDRAPFPTSTTSTGDAP
ncbi:MAG: DUF4233 domain-containing protein [Microbacteriaceae bacterium]|nr:DUF4233 domain-containing protein [Microbacteriaceae bacterium]